MTTRIFNIFPFLLITVVCVIGVEGFYRVVERFVLDVPAVTVERKTAATNTVSKSSAPKEVKKTVNYLIITRRNLFGKPPQAGVVEQPKDVVEEELEVTQLEVVLMGTVGSGDNSRAIILNKKDRKQELYAIGDDVQGANIKEIRRGKVILTHNGKDEMLDMSEASKFAPKSRRPTSVSPTTRRRTVKTQSGSTETATQQQRTTKPRVVRPTRRIVRPRTTTGSTPPSSTGEPVPPEALEALKALEEELQAEQEQ